MEMRTVASVSPKCTIISVQSPPGIVCVCMRPAGLGIWRVHLLRGAWLYAPACGRRHGRSNISPGNASLLRKSLAAIIIFASKQLQLSITTSDSMGEHAVTSHAKGAHIFACQHHRHQPRACVPLSLPVQAEHSHMVQLVGPQDPRLYRDVNGRQPYLVAGVHGYHLLARTLHPRNAAQVGAWSLQSRSCNT